MPVRVLTTADPRSLDRDPRLLELLPHVHLFATRTMQRSWKDSRMGQRVELKHLSFRGVLKRLMNRWYSPAVVLQQYATLSRILTERPKRTPRHLAFLRSQSSVLEGIRSLVEAGFAPEDYVGEETEIRLFRSLWAQTEAEDVSLSYPRTWLYRHPTGFMRRFAEALNEPEHLDQRAEFHDDFTASRTLVLHGFYFVSPVQYRIFELLDQAGVNLVFFNHYDGRLPEVFRIWHGFFDDARLPLLPSVSEWERAPVLPGLPELAISVGEMLSGRVDKVIKHQPDRVKLTRYDNFGSFLDDLREYEDRDDLPSMYAPGHEELALVLRDFFPPTSSRQEQHFLAYPVGQLLFHLHKMWDAERGELRISAGALQECFASGWLHIPGVDGRDRLHDLRRLMPFFEGCQTLEEWTDRSASLLSLSESVISAFTTPVPPEHPHHRFHRFLSNPLLRLSYLRVPQRHIEEIHQLLLRLRDVALVLFSEGEVSLQEHFDRIQREIIDRVPEEALQRQERDLLEALRIRLTENADPETRFLTRDLARAISYFLGGELEESTDRPDRPLVERFDGLDGVIYDDGRHPVWLCLLSEDALPRSQQGLGWPVRMRALDARADSPSHVLLTLRSTHTRDADVMLFFLALAWGRKLNLSWIREWQGEERVASPLLSLLMSAGDLTHNEKINKLDGAPVGVALQTHSADDWKPEGDPAPDTIEGDPEPFNIDDLPPDVYAVAGLCLRRFFYSFVADEFPAFESEFHQGFLFGNLVRAVTHFLGDVSNEEAEEHVRALFPAWNDLQVKDAVQSAVTPRGGHTSYGGAEYARARARLQFLVKGHDEYVPMDVISGVGPSARNMTAQARATLQQAISAGTAGLPPASPSTEWCRYCPHIHRCGAAMYHMEEGSDD